MNKFIGKWVDENNDTITITAAGEQVSLSYSNGRGPFLGNDYSSVGSHTLFSPIINVDFTDAGDQCTGVMGEGKLFWSNNTVWTLQK